MQLSDTSLARYFINALISKNPATLDKAVEVAEFLRTHEAYAQSPLGGTGLKAQYAGLGQQPTSK